MPVSSLRSSSPEYVQVLKKYRALAVFRRGRNPGSGMVGVAYGPNRTDTTLRSAVRKVIEAVLIDE
jgi:hypothetical protein